VSECEVICKDMWAAGYSHISVNPTVKVFYTPEAFLFSRLLHPAMEAVLGLVHGPGLARQRHALRSALITAPVGSTLTPAQAAAVSPLATTVATVPPPVFVSCGLQGDDHWSHAGVRPPPMFQP
jgi:hypothetical protein